MYRKNSLWTVPDCDNAPYYAVNNGYTVYVKEGQFFRDQGGLTESWGKDWIPVNASSIGDARRKAASYYGIKLSWIYDY